MHRRTALTLASLALVASCSSGPAVATCVPGDSHVCACADGTSGAELCSSDGTYGACSCAPRDAGAVDAPASMDASELDLGASDDAGADATPAPSYALTVMPPAASTTLGTDTTFAVSITPLHFSGHVDLSTSGAPANWTLTFDPPSLEVVDGLESPAALHVAIPPDGSPAPTGQLLTVIAMASPGMQTAPVTLTVANEYVIDIPVGTGSGPHFGALARSTLTLRVGTTLTFHRGEVGHVIHADGPEIPHEVPGAGGPGDYSAVVGMGSPGVTDHVYCHSHGMGSGSFVLVAE